MSFIRKALERRSLADDIEAAIDNGTYGVPGFGSWDQGMVWTPGSSQGTGVDHAARLSAVYACWRILTDAISTLPIDTFRRADGVRLPHRPRPEYLNFNPPQGSRIDYLSSLVLSLLTDGNAFVATPRDRFGTPTDLIVLDPAKVAVERDKKSRQPIYKVGQNWYTPLDIMHVRGLTMPGELRGMSPVKVARDIIDGARSAQDYGTSFFDNSAMPPAVIEVPPGPNGPNQGDADGTRARKIAETWKETNGGASNAGKVGVLVGGAKLTTVSVNPEDAQWLDYRRFGIQEIARIYGVPPHLLADSSNSTSWGSGLAEQNLAFGQFSLRPWTERIEDGHNRLLTSHGMPDVFLKLNLNALLRASLEDRYKSYALAISSGFMTANEARRLEDMPPVDGGDEVLKVPVGAGLANLQEQPPSNDDGDSQ